MGLLPGDVFEGRSVGQRLSDDGAFRLLLGLSWSSLGDTSLGVKATLVSLRGQIGRASCRARV